MASTTCSSARRTAAMRTSCSASRIFRRRPTFRIPTEFRSCASMAASSTSPYRQLVANAGDVNGDGIEDILVANSLEDGNGGATYVIYGTDGALSETDQPVRPRARRGCENRRRCAGRLLRRSRSPAPATSTVTVTTTSSSAPHCTDPGEPLSATDAYVVFGGTGDTLETTALDGIANLTGSNGFRIVGDSS